MESRGKIVHLRVEEYLDAKANIIIVHGLGEHIGRYDELYKIFADLGLNVYGYDRIGEGQSEGKRAYIHVFDEQVEDLVKLKSALIDNDLPTFMYGHSLGGLIVVKYLVDSPMNNLAGVILSGALLKVDDDVSPLLQKISGFVASILPTLKTVKVDTALLSRDPKIKQTYEADPFCYHGGTPARTGDQILKETASLQSKYKNINVPMLITHGGCDKLSDPKGSITLHDSITSDDKMLIVYEDMYHEIMHEVNKELFFTDVTKWLSMRMEVF